MKPERSSIPSPPCNPKGTPAASLSEDTPGINICTKHSSPRTAVPYAYRSVHPDHRTSTPFLLCWRDGKEKECGNESQRPVSEAARSCVVKKWRSY
ncbi:Hypothetical protein SMAX5B_021079 [Scophthalmus maximus]|uniref:Uncharacterized protein n=1 Tax=Scophthalmus maximus TaxID=52904 RepID=A0A2U9CR38_SCOMX|nr:Hypothetical protein SMAX5B_021079 [Scophthalmus maximus]